MELRLPSSEMSETSPKTDHSLAMFSNLFKGMVYFRWSLLNLHVQVVQKM